MDRVNYEKARQGPPQGRPIQFGVLGDNFVSLQEIVKKIKTEMKSIEGVLNPQDSFVPGKTEWQVFPHPTKTTRFFTHQHLFRVQLWLM